MKAMVLEKNAPVEQSPLRWMDVPTPQPAEGAVYMVARRPNHRRLAMEMGAVWAGESPQELPVKVDIAIVFAPAGELVPPALEKVEKGGTLK